MPTPIGHALAGFAVAGLAGSKKPLSMAQVGALMVCACAPDLDLVLNLVDGVNHHRGPSHSVGAVILSALVAALFQKAGFKAPNGIWVALAWASHLCLDYVGVDTSPPAGEMALWPFSAAFYISPISIFYDVPRVFTWAAIRHNVTAVAIELAIMLPIAWLCWKRRSPTST